MPASMDIQRAIGKLEQDLSPYQPELVSELNRILYAVKMHERIVGFIPPAQTALGHKPKRLTVAGHSVQTDAALEALCESD